MSRAIAVAPGQRYGRWVILSVSRRGRVTFAVCRCECGTEREIDSGSLRRARRASRSCGCLAAELLSAAATKHGHASTRRGPTTEYRIWRGVIGRCCAPATKAYRNYGGRGIAVCDRWRGPNGFVNFLADMGPRPAGKSIDRIDVNGNYEPSNCRWATAIEQGRNKRDSILTADLVNEIRGRKEHGESLRSIAARVGVSHTCVLQVVHHRTWSETP